MILYDVLSSPNELYRIRSANPDDARDIYALKLQAFGGKYLIYTIYQAPQSVRYLTELIARDSKFSSHSFFVISRADEVLGYYHAVRRNKEFFLHYIAVKAMAQGQGLGKALLEHYEDKGRELGCQQLVLDVFDSNRQARDWYRNCGYRLDSVSISARLSLNSWIVENFFPLDYDSDVWTRASREEQVRGFSKIECLCGSGRLTVGLIAGHVCKLLHYEGIDLQHAIFSIVHQFRTEREILVVSSLPDVPEGWPVLSAETVLRLLKSV